MASDFHVRARAGRWLIILAALASLSIGATPVIAKSNQPGFKTSQPSMLTSLAPGGSVMPIITVGDTIGSYMFEALPDGISFQANGNGTVDLFINHEGSTVPFPYSLTPPATNPNLNDMTDALVSKLKLQQGSKGVVSGALAINDSENFHRFCSNFLADSSAGFKTPTLFTNEEGIDWVNRTGMQWPATVGDDAAREIGLVVAHDVNNGKTQPIWGMGRFNHENSVAVTGYDKPVLLSGDDTFTSDPAQSQVYSYIAPNSDAVWSDTGDLWAFVPDAAYAAVNNYYAFPIGSAMSISGHFVQVPKAIATGRNPDGTDMMAADVPAAYGGPYGLPPAGQWSNSAGTTTPIDGPQWVLEHWSDLNNVFQFVRIEDMAYDKRPDMSNVVYLADSGRGATSPGLSPFTSSNGRIWKMVLDPSDPTKVTSLSILIEGDDNPVKTLNEIHQPDNLETTINGLYITEDPGSSQQFTAAQQVSDAARATTARLWQFDWATSTPDPVAKVDQSADEGPTDVDPAPFTVPGSWGAWETTGVIDASSMFGPGTFLINVQAHTLFTATSPGPDISNPPAGNDWLNKREGGQLLLLTVPGG
jgi:hypothetical protein